MVEPTARQPIRVLDTAVAGGIAAGEIIERPVSAVKELVENSIDAGASAITVELSEGGLDSIRVSDNGAGIPADEILLAFHRHGTSKIRGLDDLGNLSSFGFRGEALPSIAAVGDVFLTSRPDGIDHATRVHVLESVVHDVTVVSSAPGTTVEVQRLFYSIPARLKYLRSATSEAARTRRLLQHTALVFPWIRFQLISDGKTIFLTTGNADSREVFALVHARGNERAIIPVLPSELSTYKVSGYLLDPNSDRGSRQGISIFVNSRWVMNRAISMAIEDAFRGYLMEKRFPVASIHVEVPPGEVDINVHPSKREVRFARDSEVFTSVSRSIRESLEQEIAIRRSGTPRQDSDTDSHGFYPQSEDQRRYSDTDLFDTFEVRGEKHEVVSDSPPLLQSFLGLHTIRGPRVLGQLGNTYVMAEDSEGLILVDQHAAHESVIYHRLLQDNEHKLGAQQPLLDPLPVELSPDQSERLELLLPDFLQFGIEIEHFGAFGWIVRSVPTSAQGLPISDLIAEVLAESSAEWERRIRRPFESMAASISCHGSIRAGKNLRPAEMEALLMQLAAESLSGFCPHGRPTALRVTRGEIDRRFGRI